MPLTGLPFCGTGSRPELQRDGLSGELAPPRTPVRGGDGLSRDWRLGPSPDSRVAGQALPRSGRELDYRGIRDMNEPYKG